MCKAGYPAQIRGPLARRQTPPAFRLLGSELLDTWNRATAAYIAYPSATSATPAHTSKTPVHRAALTSSPKIYFAPNVPTT